MRIHHFSWERRHEFLLNFLVVEHFSVISSSVLIPGSRKDLKFLLKDFLRSLTKDMIFSSERLFNERQILAALTKSIRLCRKATKDQGFWDWKTFLLFERRQLQLFERLVSTQFDRVCSHFFKTHKTASLFGSKIFIVTASRQHFDGIPVTLSKFMIFDGFPQFPHKRCQLLKWKTFIVWKTCVISSQRKTWWFFWKTF